MLQKDELVDKIISIIFKKHLKQKNEKENIRETYNTFLNAAIDLAQDCF